jgi:hypothetical protein
LKRRALVALPAIALVACNAILGIDDPIIAAQPDSGSNTDAGPPRDADATAPITIEAKCTDELDCTPTNGGTTSRIALLREGALCLFSTNGHLATFDGDGGLLTTLADGGLASAGQYARTDAGFDVSQPNGTKLVCVTKPKAASQNGDQGAGFACGQLLTSGTDDSLERKIYLPDSGSFTFTYDPLIVSDRFQVVDALGTTVFDTQCASIGDTHSITPDTPAHSITVKVAANCGNGSTTSAWSYTVGCGQ